MFTYLLWTLSTVFTLSTVDVKHRVYLLTVDVKRHVYLLTVDVKHRVYLLTVDVKHHVHLLTYFLLCAFSVFKFIFTNPLQP